MIASAVFVLLFGAVFCANPHGGHLTIPQISEQLWTLADIDHSGKLSLVELIREFITGFDQDGSTCAASNEFVHKWQHNYKDTHRAALHVFQHFDLDHDNLICQKDIEELFKHIDHDGDNAIDHYEFNTLMFYIYGRLPLPDETHTTT